MIVRMRHGFDVEVFFVGIGLYASSTESNTHRMSEVTSMQQTHMAQDIGEQIAAIQQCHRGAHEAIERVLGLARDTDPRDRGAALKLLEAAEEIGRTGQARQGQLVQILAEANRVKAHRGGLAPWISAHLDSTEGGARTLAQTAREIGHRPELSEPLSSGLVGAATMRTLSRTARAAKGTDTDVAQALTTTLETAASQGVGEAVRRVRILEEAPGTGPCTERGEDPLVEQRRRSFLRLQRAVGGEVRLDGLLDAEGAAVFQAALDQIVSVRAEGQGGCGAASPEGAQTIEQLQARALIRIAEVFAKAEAAAAGARAESLFGLVLPCGLRSDSAPGTADLIPHPATQPVLLEATRLDRGQAVRLFAAVQRVGVAWRDKVCTLSACCRLPMCPPVPAQQRIRA